MGDRRQLNRGFFLISKIICSISSIAALCMCLVGQIRIEGGIYRIGRHLTWIDLFKDADDGEIILGLATLIVLFFCLSVSVLFSWLNVPVVSIIGYVISMIANTSCWLLIIIIEDAFDFLHLSVGAYMIIVFCSIGMIFAIKQCVDYFKWKRNNSAGESSFVQPQPMYNGFNNFSGNASDEQMTVSLQDIPDTQRQPQGTAAPQNGTITGINGSCAGYQLQLRTGEQVMIGKDAKVSNIVVDNFNQAVSRRHVGISYDAARGKYCVTDYSSNGTFVNGNRLIKNKTVFISPGSEIMLADDKNTFLLG